jgi:hypothetical protein
MNSDEENYSDIPEDYQKIFLSQIEKNCIVHKYWNDQSTHSRLSLSSNSQKVTRNEYYEINPLSLSHCFSICSLFRTTILIANRNSKFEFSSGLLDRSLYEFDLNLANSIGKIDRTWGVVIEKNQNQIFSKIEFWENGKQKGEKRMEIRDGDEILFFLSPSLSSFDFTSEEGECQLFMNNDYLWSFSERICMEEEYSFGISPSPGLSFEILSNQSMELSISSLLELVFSEQQQKKEGKQEKIHDDDEREDESSLTNISSEEKADTVSKQEKEEDSESPVRSTISIPIAERGRPPVPSFFPEKCQPIASFPFPFGPKQPMKTTTTTTSSEMDQEAMISCCVCLSSNKSVLLLPCKHLCLCDDCGITRKPAIEYCPICRLRITNRMKVFL